MTEKIFVTPEYGKVLQSKLDEKVDVYRNMHQARGEAAADSWHDNFAYESATEKVKIYSSQLQKFVKKTMIEDNTEAFVVPETTPESGFFTLIDFSAYKKKSFNGQIIKNDKDLLFFLYKDAGIKYITGQSIGWPGKELIGRFSFSLDRENKKSWNRNK